MTIPRRLQAAGPQLRRLLRRPFRRGSRRLARGLGRGWRRPGLRWPKLTWPSRWLWPWPLTWTRAGAPQPTAETAPKARPTPRWRGWRLPGGLRPWITCLSLGFLMAALLSHGRQMRQYNLDAQGWLWLLLGVGACLLSLVVSGLAWVVILRWLGLRPRSTPVVSLYILTNLRKFLPGGIWHLASRVQALRRPNAALGTAATTGTALLAVLIEPLLAATAALALVTLGGWQNGLGLLSLLPLALLFPRWLNPLLLRLERGKASQLGLSIAAPPSDSPADPAVGPLLDGPDDGRDASADVFAAVAPPARADGEEATLRAGQVKAYPWLPLLAQGAFVLLRFAGLACCVWAFDLQQTLPWPTWLSAFALSWTLGLVVPGAPGGLGVFEAALLLRLSGALPEPAVLAVALSYRLVVTVADLLAAGLVGLDERIAALTAGGPAANGPPPPFSQDGPSA